MKKKKKRKLEKGDPCVVVTKGMFRNNCVVGETHRHNIDVIMIGGTQETYQKGNVYHHSEMDEAIEYFEKLRK